MSSLPAVCQNRPSVEPWKDATEGRFWRSILPSEVVFGFLLPSEADFGFGQSTLKADFGFGQSTPKADFG